MAASDLGRPRLQLAVKECIPRVEARMDFNRDGKPDVVETGEVEDEIFDKYLYVFSAAGTDYGIKESSPGWTSRTHFGCALQHMAHEGEPVNPKASGGKKAEKIEQEVYFDLSGAMWPLDMAGLESTPRHKRPHPKYEKDMPKSDADRAARDRDLRDRGRYGLDRLHLDMGGPAKRFYFLLSPFRLGPKALKAALDNPDGLSLWVSPKVRDEKKKLEAPTLDELKAQGLNGSVFVVDPYAFARNICEEFYELALMNFFGMLGQIQAGIVPGVSREHFETRKNQGTIEDLHFIATVLSQVQSDDTDVWKLVDQAKIEEVVGGYGQALSHRGAAVELAAAHLANWMSGPAHAILDTCIVEDLEDSADPLAGDDKGAALCYWHNQTRLLQGSAAGTAFLRRMMIDGPTPNPIRDFLKRYAKPNAPLKGGSTDEAMFTMAAEIVADIGLRWLYRLMEGFCTSDGMPDPDKAPEVAGQIADIVNNLGYFGVELGNEARAKQKLPADYLVEVSKNVGKHIPKAAVYIVGDAPAKVSSVKVDGDSVFEVSDRGWIADRYFRARVAKMTTLFTGEQLKRIRDMETLGHALTDLTRRGDQLIKDAEGLIEFNRRRMQEVREAQREVRRRTGPLAKVDRHMAYLSELKSKALRELDTARSVNKERARALADLHSRPLPKDPEPRAARLRLIESAQNGLSQSATKLHEAESMLRSAEGRIALLEADRAKLLQLQGEADRARLANKVLEDAKKAAREGRKAVARFQDAAGALDEETKKFADTRKTGLNAAKVFVSYASLAIEIAYLGRQLEDPNAKSGKTAWAVADVGKATLDVAKDMMKFHGVKEHDFAKFFADQQKKAGESLLRRQQLLGYARSIVQPANAMTALAVVGAVAGAYNVAKYGYKGLEAIGDGDMSVAIGAGVAVLGGVLTISSALGFGVAGSALTLGLGMSATGVATVAGILVIIGALTIALTADSEWEFFAKHCYFAEGSRRNKRPMSKGASHWMGQVEDEGSRGESGAVPDLVETIPWNVRSQRLALERLLSRFSISSAFGFSNWPDEDHKSEDQGILGKPITIGGTIIVDFQYLPVGCKLNVVVEAVPLFSGEPKKAWEPFNFTDETLNAGPVSVGQDLVGRFVQVGRGGFICLILRDKDVQPFARLQVTARLTLPDSTVISGIHHILQLQRTEYTTLAGHKFLTHMEHVGDPTFADTYAGATDPVFRP